MGNQENGEDVRELLAALHAKKSWLDRVIRILESADRLHDEHLIAGALARYRKNAGLRSKLACAVRRASNAAGAAFYRHSVRRRGGL